MSDRAYAQLWRVADGAVRDALRKHPDYLTPKGQRSARRSIVKRVTGTVLGFALQEAKRQRELAVTDDRSAKGNHQAVGAATTPAAEAGAFFPQPIHYFGDVVTSDVHDYGLAGAMRHDFLVPYKPDALYGKTVHWIISNPPFRLAERFIDTASKIACHGFAFLVRTSFLEGVGRYENLFSKNPPSVVAQFSERVPMVKGRYDPAASTATSYCWLVWRKHQIGTRLMWIPPCRRELERESDWPKKEAA